VRNQQFRWQSLLPALDEWRPGVAGTDVGRLGSMAFGMLTGMALDGSMEHGFRD
jgi:hypothetical protein